MKVESDGEGGTGQKGSKGSSGKRTMRGVRAKVRPRMSVGMLFTNDLQCQNEWFAVYMQVLLASGTASHSRLVSHKIQNNSRSNAYKQEAWGHCRCWCSVSTACQLQVVQHAAMCMTQRSDQSTQASLEP